MSFFKMFFSRSPNRTRRRCSERHETRMMSNHITDLEQKPVLRRWSTKYEVRTSTTTAKCVGSWIECLKNYRAFITVLIVLLRWIVGLVVRVRSKVCGPFFVGNSIQEGGNAAAAKLRFAVIYCDRQPEHETSVQIRVVPSTFDSTDTVAVRTAAATAVLTIILRANRVRARGRVR